MGELEGKAKNHQIPFGVFFSFHDQNIIPGSDLGITHIRKPDDSLNQDLGLVKIGHPDTVDDSLQVAGLNLVHPLMD